MYKIIALLVIVISLTETGCKHSNSIKQTEAVVVSTVQQDSRKMDSFTYLKKCMRGDFSSTEQSLHDSDYFDIRLRMIPIWEATPERFYLYVEQAVSTSLDKPYRIRVYEVVKSDRENFTSYIYKLKNPERFIGKKEQDPIFNTFTADSLELLEGCEVKLRFDENKWEFNGATGEKTCPSERSGASWATSKVTMNDERMISWDQGWDKEGKQVWGAVKGGYVFKKSE
jgi:CpeT protein